MKLKTILEGKAKSEWRLHKDQQGIPELVLYSDWGSGKPLDYAAEFVHPREDRLEFYAQRTKVFGDRVEWGGSHTKKKDFHSLSELNNFLKKEELPEVTHDQLKKLLPDDMAVIGSPGITTHYFSISIKSMDEMRPKCNDEEEFVKAIIARLKKATKSWALPANKITKETDKCLRDFYKSGKWPEVH